MESSHDQTVRAEVSAPAELIVQNGRLKGSSKPLVPPLALIGQAAGCDIRLNVEGVRPLHCVLVHTPMGLVLRDLQGGNGTVVNGKPTATCVLQNGDQLVIGPFQFLVRVTASFVARVVEPATRNSPEREALRIQAAAVAAQQAALAEEEARLKQRRASLEQQQEQLAAHLEEKRRRLAELRDQTREAYTALKKERADHDSNRSESLAELGAVRHEADDQLEQARAERRRLKLLHRRMKRRWHRHWAAERAAMRRREVEFAQQQEELEKERQQLAQARLAFNSEMELGRRELRAEWDQLYRQRTQEEEEQVQERAELVEQAAILEEHEAELAEAEHQLAAEQQRWQEKRRKLEREVEGLENRARNGRRKIGDNEEEIARLEARRLGLQGDSGQDDSSPAPAPAELVPVASTSTLPVPSPAVEILPAETQMASLERLAGELADQRIQLAEQCRRLAQAQKRWQHHRRAGAAELESLGRRLLEREQAIGAREKVLDGAEHQLRQHQAETLRLQRHLEGWQARMTAREAAWESERERLLADLGAREKLAAGRLHAVEQLHQRWIKRRHREVEWLKAERSACEKLRRECVGLRDEWLRRAAALEQEQRRQAEQALAMEQYQQQILGQADNASAAGKRLDKLRKRWAARSAAAAKAVAQEREELRTEADRVERLNGRLQRHSANLAAHEAELSSQQSEWEKSRLQLEDELNRLRQELVSQRAQSSRFEREASDLRDEVERLARLFLDESEPIRLPAAA